MISLWDRANQIIPGGNHLFSKTPDRYCPGKWPPYYKIARGIDIESLDGRKFKDFSVMGAGNSILGYCDPDVESAIIDAHINGNVSTLNCPEEVELAELMLTLNPKMDMVRFGRSGNDACQIAARIASEYSENKCGFAICGYHGWQIGHPPHLDPLVESFEYGDINQFSYIIDEYQPAFVMMECIRSKPADKPFLKEIRHITETEGIPLIFDEVASGFRCNLGGYHQLLGIYPDIVLYGKAMGNGTAISAVVGKEEFMEKAKNTFISSMFWSERSGYVAGITTLEKMKRVGAQSKIIQTGMQIKDIWQIASDNADLPIEISGLDPLATFNIIDDSNRIKITTFTQEMLKRGYLAGNQLYTSVMHKKKDIDGYAEAVCIVFEGISNGTLVLEGDPATAGFTRLV